jgi:site-specific DNA-methyltransferase (adenine-specific)
MSEATTDVLELVEIETLQEHPGNPAVRMGWWREDVIDVIAEQLKADGAFRQKHAIQVRSVDGGLQIVAGHHRVRAAAKAGLTHVYAWVEEMTDEEAHMALALDNNHGEWSPLHYGLHALEHVELGVGHGRGQKGGLREYARAVGRGEKYLRQCKQAAEVVVKSAGLSPHFLDKVKHLAAIHGAPEQLWPLLVETMIAKEWSAADTKYWVDKLKDYVIPKEWESVFLPELDVITRFLETKEFSTATVAKLCQEADLVAGVIDAAEIPYAERVKLRNEFLEWLKENAGADSWEARKIRGYRARVEAEIAEHEQEEEERVDGWKHGRWQDHIASLDDGSVRLLLTDPPYGVGYQSDYRLDRRKDRKHKNIEGDADLAALGEMLESFSGKLAKDAHVLVFCHPSNEPKVRQIMVDAGYTIRSYLVWDKELTGMGDPDTTFAPRHERIVHAVKGKPVLMYREANVLRVKRASSDRHPTEKPVELLKLLVAATTVEGELVADPFGGVASTMVAANDLKRRYWGCEVEEAYWREGAGRLT